MKLFDRMFANETMIPFPCLEIRERKFISTSGWGICESIIDVKTFKFFKPFKKIEHESIVVFF